MSDIEALGAVHRSILQAAATTILDPESGQTAFGHVYASGTIDSFGASTSVYIDEHG
jgi:hypothetical protein